MSPSTKLVRPIKVMLAILAVVQTAALISFGPAAVLLADDPEGTPGASATPAGGDGGVEASAGEPAPPASSVSSSSTGDSPPVVTPSIAGTEGSGGWYVSDVSIAWTVTDDETPVSSQEGCDAASVTADTAGQEFTCTATSDGGSTTTTATIARDATDPDGLAVDTDTDPASSGWFVAPFTATWTGNDATSGIAGCTEHAYSGPDTDAGSLDGTCTDRAGNESAPLAFTFRYDATVPSVAGSPDRTPDHNDWYNAPVTISWTAGEGETCDAPTLYAGPDIGTASVTGGCTDEAGNVGTGIFLFKFDDTDPFITLTTPGDAVVYILRQPVTADYSCTDATSGVDTCTGPVASGAAIDTGSVGAKTFGVEAADQAGNPASASHSYRVQYRPEGDDCGGVAGHEILTPISKRGDGSFKQGSTVPAKFRVCDWFGEPVTAGGVVSSFRIVSVGGADADQAVDPTSSHDEFRAGDAQWIFNIATKELSKDRHGFRIGLDDDTAIDFAFTLR